MDEIRELISSAPTGFSLGAIVAVGIYSLIRGFLVPRRVLLDLIREKDSQIALLAKERDDWRGAYMASKDENAELVRQNGELIESGKTTRSVIDALRSAVLPRFPEGDRAPMAKE